MSLPNTMHCPLKTSSSQSSPISESATPSKPDRLYVIKRNGTKERVLFDKITRRNELLSKDLELDVAELTCTVVNGFRSGITTEQLDILSAETAVYLSVYNRDFEVLAKRIAVDNLHKKTQLTFSQVTEKFHQMKIKQKKSYLNEEYYEFVKRNAEELDRMLDHDRDYLFNYFGFKTLEHGYLWKDLEGKILESPQMMWLRVACFLRMPDLKAVKEVYDALSTLKFTHASPTLFNAGSRYAQCSSCYLVAMESDSVEGIYSTLKKVAQISKFAGGVGISVQNIRSQGSVISSTNGKSDGIIPMLRNFNETARYINQTGRRKGSTAVYLEPWHSDVMDFLRIKINSTHENARCLDLHNAMWVPDLFMKRVQSDQEWSLFCPNDCPDLCDTYGDEFETRYALYEKQGKAKSTLKARTVFKAILTAQMETGEPYVLFKDNINKKTNHQNLGTIRGSNLCVTGDTVILTDRGQFRIDSLVGQGVNVWNGEAWSPTTVIKTGQNQPIIKVMLSNGTHVECTPYHKFLTTSGRKVSIKTADRVDAKDLTPGTKLLKFNLVGVGGDSSFNVKYPYTHGFFCFDGTCAPSRKTVTGFPIAYLYGQKKLLIPYLTIGHASSEDAKDRIMVQLPLDLEKKFIVPVNSERENKLQWLAGYADAGGDVYRNGENESLYLSSCNPLFLRDIQLMLQTLGIFSEVRGVRGKKEKLLPGGDGGQKKYRCKHVERLLIPSSELTKLIDMGFKPHGLIIRGSVSQRGARAFIRVVGIQNNGKRADTFCFNEPKNHAGVFNGNLLGNCTEIVQYSSPDRIAVCNLSSIALPAFVKEKEGAFDFAEFGRIVEMVVENLNNVIDLNFYPVKEAELSNMETRPIGIGVQGLADVFAMLDLAWEDDQARQLNRDIFECMYYFAMKKSCELAKQKGTYPLYAGCPVSKGQLQFDMWGVEPTTVNGLCDWKSLKESIREYGVRNSLVTTVMPTASTSQILGNNECIEPYTSNIYTRQVLSGDFPVINKRLYDKLRYFGLDTKRILNRIIKNQGSIQDISDIPDNIKRQFKTVWEIPQKVLVDMALDRGPYIDQSQSMNLFFSTPTIKKLSTSLFYSWSRGQKTGNYYIRRQSIVNPIQFTVEQDVCTSCSA